MKIVQIDGQHFVWPLCQGIRQNGRNDKRKMDPPSIIADGIIVSRRDYGILRVSLNMQAIFCSLLLQIGNIGQGQTLLKNGSAVIRVIDLCAVAAA